MALIFAILLIVSENAKSVNFGVVEIIAGMAGLLTAGAWIGNYLNTRQKNSLDYKSRIAEFEDKKDDAKIEKLTQRIQTLLQKIKGLEDILEQERKEHQKEIETFRKREQEKERQLSSINVAFNLVYLSLKDLLGNSTREQQLMEELKKYIKNGTGNITSSPQ